MTEEERLEIIEMGYKDHVEAIEQAFGAEELNWNDGAMFGIRFALISLGHKIDFDKWNNNEILNKADTH